MKMIDPGHRYELANHGDAQTQPVQFVKKERRDGADESAPLKLVHDGTTTEEVIAMLLDRLTFLNGVLPSEFNEIAIQGLQASMRALNERTSDRLAKGIEGTAQ